MGGSVKSIRSYSSGYLDEHRMVEMDLTGWCVPEGCHVLLEDGVWFVERLERLESPLTRVVLER